ncbi:MAG: hypothetical protein ACE5EA_01045 [Nitrospirota bacterium]
MKRILILIIAIVAIGLGVYGCGETDPNPLSALDVQSTETGSTQAVANTDTGTTTSTDSGQPVIAQPILPDTDLSSKAVIAMTIGHDAGKKANKGGLSPQNHSNDENPHETKDVSMIITDVMLVTAVLDADQNPQWDVIKDISGNVTDASLQRAANTTDIILLQSGSQRRSIFGCGSLTFPNPDLPTPSLTCAFNDVLQVATIPVQDAITRADQNKRYNGILIKYQKGSIEITDNFLGLLSENCGTNSSCTPVAEITMPVQLAPNLNPDDNINSSLDDYVQADVGQFFLPITTPQVFGNAVYKLRIDPFSQLGAIRAAAFNPGLGTNKWQVVISGSVDFESMPPSAEIVLGTKTEGGTVIQINNPFVPEGSTTDETGQNVALPNPDPSTYWFQPRQQQDQIGTVGQPILVCTTDDCDELGVDSVSTSVLKPDGTETICNGALIDRIACQSRAVDGAFAGTPHVITGNVVLLTTPNPDFSGLLGFGTLAFRTPTMVHITEVAQPGNQPPQ